VYSKRITLPSGTEVHLIGDVIYYTENPQDEAYIRDNREDFEVVEPEEGKTGRKKKK
jgi:hypothetical protein